MNDKSTQPRDELLTADVKQKSRKVAPVWIIPIIAAAIGGWMVLQKAFEEKVIIEVTFKDASGIVAGKTDVRLHNITLGKVTKVNFTQDLSRVTVTMEFQNIKSSQFTEEMRFWVVKPRVSIDGVSGLHTLLSGAYIEIDPGEGGKPATKFIGLEQPGVYQLGNPGTSFILHANELGSLHKGSPVKFRNVRVGTIQNYQLAKDNKQVEIEIFVRAPYDKIIEPQTRFWSLSGFKVDVNAEGVKVKVESIATLMSGGIGFFTKQISTNPPSKEGDTFRLYDTEEELFEERIQFDVPIKLYFANGVKGLLKGAPVEYKGLRFGTVIDIGVEVSQEKEDLLTYAIIAIEPERLPHIECSKLSSSERIDRVYDFFDVMVKKGLRAQLTNGYLLTGKSLVIFAVFPRAEKNTLKFANGIAIVPTVPEVLDSAIDKVNTILEHIANMPIVDTCKNFSKVALSLSRLAESLDDGGVTGEQAREVMEELRKSARSLRGITNYLERYPEALIKGKGVK